MVMPGDSLVTVTFNPAVDKSTAVASMIPEKKLLCSNPVLEPGGGGINVARAIKKLGGEALAIYPAGGYNGQLLQRLLEKEGVASMPIPVKHDTRENLVVLDSGANLQYRFGMPGPEMEPNEWQQCLRAIEQVNNPGYIVASGSLTTGVPKDIFAQMAVIAKRKNARLVVDTSGEALKAALQEGIYMIKPNMGELAVLAGREELDFEALPLVAKELIGQGRCQVIVVSMGPGGAMLITKDITQYIAAPPVRRKSTIGAGDSMVGGIVLSLSKGKGLIESVKYGVACGSAATINPGTALCRLEEVEKLYNMICN